MMSEIPLEGLSSKTTYNEPAVMVSDTTDALKTPPSNIQQTDEPGPSLIRRLSSAFLCCDKSNQSTPLHHVQPVILRPMSDVYIELKPHRRIRVIHLPPTVSSSVDERDEVNPTGINDPTVHVNDSSDDEYWFENADPKRLPIEPQPSVSGQQRRIFHKLAPQDRIKAVRSNSTKSEKNFVSPGRLPRKKFMTSKSDSDLRSPKQQKRDLTPKRNLASPVSNLQETPLGDIPIVVSNNFNPDMIDGILTTVPDSTTNLNDSTNSEDSDSSIDGGRKSPKTFDVESPDPTHISVVTIPDPGESCTDDETSDKPSQGTGSIVVVTGSYLGGVANIGFEDEEVDAPSEDVGDNGAGSNRRLSDISVSLTCDTEVEKLPDVAPAEAKPEIVQASPPPLANDEPKKQKPVLFFIHGVGGSADTWQNQFSYFSTLGYEVVAPDLLGHGFSSTPDRPKAYTFTKLFHDTLTIFDHFCVADGRQRPCVVIGHSYGGSIATAVARSRPDSVKVLVLIASGGPTALVSPVASSSKLSSCLEPIFNRCAFLQRKRAKGKGKTTGIHDGFHVPPYVISHTLMGQNWPEGDVAFHRRVMVPTLLVYGLKDGFVSLVEMCEMERTIPKAYLELIPLAGHHVMQDQPRELNVMMKKFIERYVPGLAT